MEFDQYTNTKRKKKKVEEKNDPFVLVGLTAVILISQKKKNYIYPNIITISFLFFFIFGENNNIVLYDCQAVPKGLLFQY